MQNGVTLSKGVTWLIGIILPLMLLVLSGMGRLLWEMNDKITRLQSDVAIAISVAAKNEDDIDVHRKEHEAELKKKLEKLEEN